jgi:hypothetical protein
MCSCIQVAADEPVTSKVTAHYAPVDSRRYTNAILVLAMLSLVTPTAHVSYKHEGPIP